MRPQPLSQHALLPLAMLQYDPNFSRCALRIATCYCRLGDFEAAEAHLRGMERSSAGALGAAGAELQ